MKNSILIIAACIISFAVASCGGNNSSNEVAKLQDSIAALKAQLDNTPKVEKKVRTSSQSNEQKSLEGIPNTYTFTDELGDKWTLTLNENEGGRLEKGDYVAYCSWFYDRRGIRLFFGDDQPTICFKKGKETNFITYIVDGYFYASSTSADAKDPNRRLPITKIE